MCMPLLCIRFTLSQMDFTDVHCDLVNQFECCVKWQCLVHYVMMMMMVM